MLQVLVTRLMHEAEGVLGVELGALDGLPLPAFTAGAHIDLHLPNGLCRQYSLTNDSRETDRYRLGVGLAADSRGGSRYLHETLAVGHRLPVGAPRSLFGIDTSATEHVFIAGGIGITPILSMIRWCESAERPWRLLYCVRSAARAAYLWPLAPFHERVHLHADEDRAGAYPDVAGFLADAPVGSHVYCCGPGPLMDAVARCAKEVGIPDAATHFERFVAEIRSPAESQAEKDFTVILRRHGGKFTVPAGISILETLERNGITHPFSCREGLCRTCEVAVVAGSAEHRDCVLSEEERSDNTSIMVCVSRATSAELVLDL